MNKIIFDSKLKEKIVKKALNKDINEERNIIDKLTEQEVLSPDGTTVSIDDLGVFENGSEIFIKNDIVSLMEYINK